MNKRDITKIEKEVVLLLDELEIFFQNECITYDGCFFGIWDDLSLAFNQAKDIVKYY